MDRKCPKCGATIEFVHLASGQRVFVNPGVVPLFVGTDSSGGVVLGRVMHWQTCPGAKELNLDQTALRRITNDGAWKARQVEQPDDDRTGRKGSGGKGRR